MSSYVVDLSGHRPCTQPPASASATACMRDPAQSAEIDRSNAMKPPARWDWSRGAPHGPRVRAAGEKGPAAAAVSPAGGRLVLSIDPLTIWAS
ncbi:Os09g0410450 [Oryza sativa Japonica Group]|uniref:Uncharacterized protein n=3 Tax=Oryza sativa TaxID=4530 RepID=A0A8J8YJV1_ORYSJ|nr:hypothetical protein OsI_31333 [Oryza sativa Indica Group]EEE69689.1 hypothetical protein OsJ_29326 [Oryza sativa Japonica Group]BAT08041.1 Os09g0410450 [Oryza sativa Japonica Group]